MLKRRQHNILNNNVILLLLLLLIIVINQCNGQGIILSFLEETILKCRIGKYKSSDTCLFGLGVKMHLGKRGDAQCEEICSIFPLLRSINYDCGGCNLSDCSVQYRPGHLIVDMHGLKLSQGLTARKLATSNQPVQYDLGLGQSYELFHEKPDGAATFTTSDGGWIYVTNKERQGGKADIIKNIGGVGALTFDKDGNVINYRMLLNDTRMNCAGGKTPWNTWISAEEFWNGSIWQVDPYGVRESEQITMGLIERGPFEAFAYDDRNRYKPRFFATKDDPRGELRRFTPDNVDWDNDPWSMLHGPGVIEYMVAYEGNFLNAHGGTYEWTTDINKGKEWAEIYCPYSEGILRVDNELYVISKKLLSVLIFNLDDNTYKRISADHGTLDGGPDQIISLTGNKNDILYFTEDGGEYEATKFVGVHGLNNKGQYFTIFESYDQNRNETGGLAFSPDASRMYVSFPWNGELFEIKRTDCLNFKQNTLNPIFLNFPWIWW